jgi:hypothetical protein
MLASAHDHAWALIPSILPLPALWLLGGAAAGEWGDARLSRTFSNHSLCRCFMSNDCNSSRKHRNEYTTAN